MKSGVSPKSLVPAELGISMWLSIAAAGMVIAIIVMAAFLATTRVQPVAVDSKGSVIPLIPLDKPHVTDSRVVGFVDECLRRAFSHDYENYRMTMSTAKDCYTPAGAAEYETAIAPLIADMTRLNLVMSVSLEATVVSRRFVRDGIQVWETQTPMTLFRRGTRETLAPVRYMVMGLVIRVPLEHDVRGIAIRAINVRPYSGS